MYKWEKQRRVLAHDVNIRGIVRDVCARTYTRRNLGVTVLDGGRRGGGLNLQSCRCKNVTRRRLYTASDSFGSKDTILIQRLPLLLQCINEKYRTKNFSSLVDSFYRRRGYRLSRRNDSSRILHRDFRKSSRSRSDHARTRYNTPSEMGEIQRSNSLEIIHRSIYIYIKLRCERVEVINEKLRYSHRN